MSQPPLVDFFIALDSSVPGRGKRRVASVARVRLSADLLADKNSSRRGIICFYYRCTQGARQEKKPPKSGGSAAR